MEHIFVSPHPDDAVGSCGGTIHRLVSAGEQVTIATLFAGQAAAPYSAAALKLHTLWGAPADVVQLRRAEDRAAAARIGAGIMFEDVPDAIYRRDGRGQWLYGADSAVLGRRHPDDRWIPGYMVTRLRLAPATQARRFYFPMGIGGHVDHLTAFDIGLLLAEREEDVWWYEDFSYADERAGRTRRLADLTGWRPILGTFGDDDMRAKIAAFAYYHSQIPMLFGTHRRMERALTRAAHRAAGTRRLRGEQFWGPEPMIARAGQPDAAASLTGCSGSGTGANYPHSASSTPRLRRPELQRIPGRGLLEWLRCHGP